MLSEPSKQSLFISCRSRTGEELGTGTGFIVVHSCQPHLITNFHIMAGRHPHTGQPTHWSGATTAKLRISYIEHHRDDSSGFDITWRDRDEPVVVEDDEGFEQALWFEHPALGRRVDVAALPLTNVEGTHILPYDVSTLARPLRSGPSDGVSIIGFPFGNAGGGKLAIWTRGFIASEPMVDLDGFPRFLVDARTREGQSGSPVIAYNTGGITHYANGDIDIGGGPSLGLLGVYSGRINAESDLGYVWRADLIREILDWRKRGLSGHQDATSTGSSTQEGTFDQPGSQDSGVPRTGDRH